MNGFSERCIFVGTKFPVKKIRIGYLLKDGCDGRALVIIKKYLSPYDSPAQLLTFISGKACSKSFFFHVFQPVILQFNLFYNF